MGQKVVQDLSNSWPYIVGGLVAAMLLCLVYIVLMRWFAGIMIWLSLLSVVALLSYCKYVVWFNIVGYMIFEGIMTVCGLLGYDTLQSRR
jgi:choline transporter-like protein 2/4/5